MYSKIENNKTGGEDAIINEYIKTTSKQFIEIYEKLFNLIFDTLLFSIFEYML
jgi:ribosomal protein S17E